MVWRVGLVLWYVDAMYHCVVDVCCGVVELW